jgi:membrane protease YdiL (CAAX protease family)
MKTKKIVLFILLSAALSWIIAALIYFLKLDMNSRETTLLLILYMYMPALSALIVQKFIYKEEMIRPLRISFQLNKYFFLALIIPAVIVLITTLVGFLFPSISYTPDMSGFMERMAENLTPEQIEQMQESYDALPVHPIWLAVVQGFIAAATINALAAFGEELGWRGFLLGELRSKKFITVSLIIGVIWGLWHGPIILMGHNYPQHPKIGVLFMIVFCVLYTFLFNYFTLKSKSVIAASLMHGSINAFAGIPIMMSSRSSDLLLGSTGLAGFIVLIIAVCFLFIYDNRISKEKVLFKTIGDFSGNID